MVAALSREPAEGLNQFRSQLYAAGIDLESPLENLAPTGDNIKKTTCRLHIEDITPVILYLFETAAPALFAATVPIEIPSGFAGCHLFFTPLTP